MNVLSKTSIVTAEHNESLKSHEDSELGTGRREGERESSSGSSSEPAPCGGSSDHDSSPQGAAATTTTATTAAAVVNELSLSEKLSLLSGRSLWQLSGVRRLGIPSITVSDGPHGVRKPVSELSLQDSYPATSFPTAAALACSWDENLLETVGEALSAECRHYNVQVLLGPGMNVKRHPAAGRNFEYFSEDPVLSGRLAAAYVRGVQKSGTTAACCKHFVANNQESHRFVVNAVVDDRTLRELYLRGFELAIRGRQCRDDDDDNDDSSSSCRRQRQRERSATPPAAIMCAYNRINGRFSSEHEQLNCRILRDEWDYTGCVMTDWGATNDRVAGIKSGLDLEMPGSHGAHDRAIKRALGCGQLDISNVNDCCRRVLDLIHKYPPPPAVTAASSASAVPSNGQPGELNWSHQHQLAHDAAVECCVLLKNENRCLPLPAGTAVAVIGEFGRSSPRYQGMGSSQVNSHRVVTLYDELARYTETVLYAPGYHPDDDSVVADERGTQPALVAEAVRVARQADAVLLCIGLPEIMESEGFDRPHIRLPAQHDALVRAVCSAAQLGGGGGGRVAVILSNGGAVEMPWVHLPDAIVEGYLLGQAGGAAIADVVFGAASPCGKLAESFPCTVSDVLSDRYFSAGSSSSSFSVEHTAEYREGLDVGYRYLDRTPQRRVRFPFGHGLSYATFAYDSMQLRVQRDEETSCLVRVAFAVTNTGSVFAKEIVQCYVHDCHATVYRPVQELKDFTKISLRPGERGRVSFLLTRDAFSFYDVGHKRWVAEAGDFEIRVGASSRDIRLRGIVALKGTAPAEASALARETYPPLVNTDERGDGTSPSPRLPAPPPDEVDEGTFARRFGGRENLRLVSEPVFGRSSSLDGNDEQSGGGGDGIGRTASASAAAAAAVPLAAAVPFHRNSLLKDVAKRRLIGRLLMHIVFSAASGDLKRESASYKRQRRMLAVNVENLPLRVMVLFSKGNCSWEFLDACIAAMNGQVLRAARGFFASFCNFFSRS